MTLEGAGPDGIKHETTVFLKQNLGQPRESDAYRFLEHRGIPVARLLLSLDRATEEVLGLEFLPNIGIEADRVDEAIELVARLMLSRTSPHHSPRRHPGFPRPTSTASSRGP